jgi:hypothetical protein
MNDVTYKGQLVVLSREAYNDQCAMVSNLSDDERAEAGTFRRWPAKVVVAHCGTWQARGAQVFTAIAQGEAPPVFDDLASFNLQVYEDNWDRPWPEILANAHGAFEAFCAAVMLFPEADLCKTYRRERLWRCILHYGYLHPQRHLAQFYREHRNPSRAAWIQQAMAEAVERLGEPPKN